MNLNKFIRQDFLEEPFRSESYSASLSKRTNHLDQTHLFHFLALLQPLFRLIHYQSTLWLTTLHKIYLIRLGEYSFYFPKEQLEIKQKIDS